jgi:hypothetical protein
MVMQVLVMAVQNSVDYDNLGVATAGTTLFRSIGGALGVSLFGAIFANGLHAHLMELLPAGAAIPSAAEPSSIQALPPGIREQYVAAVMAALQPVFTVAAGVAALGFVLTCLLKELPLRGVAPIEGLEGFAMPRDATSLQELERIVTALMARENRWRVYADLATRAGLDLPAGELWLLARLGEREPVTVDALSAELTVPLNKLRGPLDALCRRALAERNNDGRVQLTAMGAEMRDRVLAARRKGLADLLTRWEPHKHPEVVALLERLVETLVRDLPAPQAGRTKAA